jgi:4-hydroxy-tetrahydrodipicolinate reductase
MSTDPQIPVVLWGTGNVGRRALKGIVEHPDLRLVGVHAHSPDKIGRDAAELAGLPSPTGVIATDDVDELLSLGAQCVCYTAMGEFRPKQMVEDLCRILAAGVNVVSTSNVNLLYPRRADRRMVDPLEKAARDGDATLLTTGFDPGWSGDLLPLVLSGACERVDSISVAEVMNYATYPDAELTGWAFGLGRKPDEDIPLFAKGALIGSWGGPVHLVADALGVELDEVTEEVDYRLADEGFDTAMGRIENGTIAAVMFAVHGMKNGKAVVNALHYNRMRSDIAPDWPKLSAGRDDGYVVTVQGSPTFTCEIEVKGEDGDNNTGGIIGSAMRPVNAIPAVVAAPAGLVTPLDLPVISARGLVRT